MLAELIAVGDELLLGDSVDTNSAWISRRLREVGAYVTRHVAVGDDIAAIADAVREASVRAGVIVVTGGLGPTQDDVTRDALARAAGVGLERREELVAAIRDGFARRGRPMPERNLVQADIPDGARVLAAVGTAPGFALAVGDAQVYCLPGVPAEMQVMLERDVLPDIARRGGGAFSVSRVVRTAGVAESEVAHVCAAVAARVEREPDMALAFLASAGETRVCVTARAPTREDAAARCAPIVADLLELLGPHVTGVDDEGVEAAVARHLTTLGWTLAVAESVTGGGVGARLVRVPGASAWFRGGVVTYATEVKRTLGGVDAGVLDAHGPVSEQTAGALAQGVRERLGADVGLAVVGVAGPDTQGGRPVGSVALAVALPDATTRTRALQLPAYDRRAVQEFAASAALDYLRRRLASFAGAA